MKAQMRFQKYLCLTMIVVGALALAYSFVYCTDSLYYLGEWVDRTTTPYSSFTARPGFNDAMLYDEVQGFNNLLMYCGIVMIVLAVLLYITACNKRRKYYVSNYVATGVCAGGNIALSVVLMVLNAHWKAEFLNVDFASWKSMYDMQVEFNPDFHLRYSESTVWFDVGYAVYAIVIVASLLLIMNLIWKIMLMKGEKALLAGNQLAGGEVA